MSFGLLACNVEVEGGSSGLSAGGSVGGDLSEGGGRDDEDDEPGSSEGGVSTGAVSSVDDTSAGIDTGLPLDTDHGTGVGTGIGTEGSTSTSTGGGSTSGSDTTTGDDGAPGDPLDPELDVPDDGETCLTPGSLGECPAVEVCRFHTTEQGRCETCEGCGNLGAPCVTGLDCDILFACYRGQCTNFCELGTFNCGPIEDCLEVGHPTHGVCAPF